MEEEWAQVVTTSQGHICRGFASFFLPVPNQTGASANKVYGIHVFAGCLACSIKQAYSWDRREDALAKSLPPEVQANLARMSIWGMSFQDYTCKLEEWKTESNLHGLTTEGNHDAP